MTKKYYRKTINIGLIMFLLLSSCSFSMAFTLDESTFGENTFGGTIEAEGTQTIPIPTINEWGIIVLVGLIIFYYFRREFEHKQYLSKMRQQHQNIEK